MGNLIHVQTASKILLYQFINNLIKILLIFVHFSDHQIKYFLFIKIIMKETIIQQQRTNLTILSSIFQFNSRMNKPLLLRLFLNCGKMS